MEVSETSHFFRAATLKKHGSGSALSRNVWNLRGFHGEFYYAEKVYNKLVSWGYVIFWYQYLF